MGLLARDQVKKMTGRIKGIFGAKGSSGPKTATMESSDCHHSNSMPQSRQTNRNYHIQEFPTEVNNNIKEWVLNFLVHTSLEDFHEIVLRASQTREDLSWQEANKKGTTDVMESNNPNLSTKRDHQWRNGSQDLRIEDLPHSNFSMTPDMEESEKMSASQHLKCKTMVNASTNPSFRHQQSDSTFFDMSSVSRSRRGSASDESLYEHNSPLHQIFSTPTSRITTPTAFNILNSVFPSDILKKLKYEMGSTIAKKHADASVFFSDITGFTDWCSKQSACTVIECLSAYFQILDDLAEQFGVYKVETIGDSWMGVCGAPNEELHHADIMGHFALEVLETLHDLQEIFQSPHITMRIGIHCGPVVSGVVRADRPRWQLFGDTVNMASRMESTGLPGHIQISRDMYNALEQSPRTKFICKSRGQIEIKGKGSQETFFLQDLECERLSDFPGPATLHIDDRRLTIFNPDSPSVSVSINKPRSTESFDRSSRKFTMRSTKISTKSSMRFVNSPIWERPATTPSAGDTAGDYDFDDLDVKHKRRSLSRAADPSTSKRMEDKLEVAKYLGQNSILVVDNMASIIIQFRRVLKKTGMTVYTAQNGYEALKLLKERQYVIVYMDLDLLKMDEFQCVHQFREWESQHRTWTQPIVAMCEATISESYQKNLTKLSFDGYIRKDVNRDTILKQVSQFRFTSSDS